MMATGISELMIAPEELAARYDLGETPVMLVDLAETQATCSILPNCPVIGFGPLDHPLAANLDVVVDSRGEALTLAESVQEQPLAAAIMVQLLRLLPDLSLQQGLMAESLAYAVLQGSEPHRAWIAGRRGIASEVGPEGSVLLEREGDVLAVTLHRPWSGNAIDRPMRDALHEAFALANADTEIARVVLRGAGKAFSLGAELAEFGTTTDPVTAHLIRCQTLPAHQAMHCADRLEVEIDGACVGSGLELAAFARRITATGRSWFQLPELNMGIIPGAGGCVSLTRRIGRQRTAWMVLSGRRVSARQALAWGLIDNIVDELA